MSMDSTGRDQSSILHRYAPAFLPAATAFRRSSPIWMNLHQDQRRTLVMVTHDPEMTRYSGRQVTLRDGIVAVQPGTGLPRLKDPAVDR